MVDGGADMADPVFTAPGLVPFTFAVLPFPLFTFMVFALAFPVTITFALPVIAFFPCVPFAIPLPFPAFTGFPLPFAVTIPFPLATFFTVPEFLPFPFPLAIAAFFIAGNKCEAE